MNYLELIIIIMIIISLGSALIYTIVYTIIDNVKKNKKLNMKDAEELYKIKDIGEVLRDFIGTMYIPLLFFIFSKYDISMCLIIFVFVAMSVAVLAVNIKIYYCKKEIRKK